MQGSNANYYTVIIAVVFCIQAVAMDRLYCRMGHTCLLILQRVLYWYVTTMSMVQCVMTSGMTLRLEWCVASLDSQMKVCFFVW